VPTVRSLRSLVAVDVLRDVSREVSAAVAGDVCAEVDCGVVDCGVVLWAAAAGAGLVSPDVVAVVVDDPGWLVVPAVVSGEVVVAAVLPFTRVIWLPFQSLTSEDVESVDITDSPDARAIVIA